MADPADQAFQQRVERLEELIRSAEQWPERAARNRLQEVVRSLLDVHGTALERILEHIARAGEAGSGIIDALGQDELIGSLLLLYGLHPVDLESRVQQALDGVQPQLRSHGATVELLDLADGVVHLRFENGAGDPLSALNRKRDIEDAILAKAPDVSAITIAGDGLPSVTTGNGRPRLSLPLAQGV
jgi:Fe-S cluster biogenesis protein NfuA